MSPRALLQIASLGMALACAVYADGGLQEGPWLISMAAVGLIGLVSWSRKPSGPRLPGLSAWVRIPLIALPCYLLVQLMPLPLTILRRISPARAEAVQMLDWLHLSRGFATGFAALSAMPAATAYQLVRLLCYLVVLLIVREVTLQVSENPWVATWPLIALGFWQAAIGVMQFSPTALDVAAGLAVGTYQSRNHFAGFLEMIAPLAVLYSVRVFSPQPVRAGNRPPLMIRCLPLVGALVMVTAIVLSLSRTGLIAAFAALLFAGVLAARPVIGGRWAKAAPILGLGAIATALAVGLVAVAPNRLLDRFAELAHSGSRDSAEFRVALWRDTLLMLNDYPIFGCGAGAFQYAFPKYQQALPLFSIDFAHNDYLQAAAELGAVGGLLLMAAWLGLLTAAWKAAGERVRSDRQLLGAACMGAFLAILLHSLADYNTYIPANGFLLSWIAGIALGLPVVPVEHKPIVTVGGYTVIDVTARVVEGGR